MDKVVALFTDRTGLPGLHVTLFSMLAYSGLQDDKDLSIYVFCDKIDDTEKERIARTHASTKSESRLHLVDNSPVLPSGANPLYGSSTAYGRIYLSELLPEVNRCVYLDIDLIVNTSISKLFEFFDGENVLFADCAMNREYSLDKELYRLAKVPMEINCFNSGVLGIDLDLWRKGNVTERLYDCARKYPGMFRSSDQTLLNTVLFDSCKAIGDTFNTCITPRDKAVRNAQDRIYHLIGSPKPWDPSGFLLHPNYHWWKSLYNQTALAGMATSRFHTMKRRIMISGSTGRLLLAWLSRRARFERSK